MRQENVLVERAQYFVRRSMQAEKALARISRKYYLGERYQRVAPRTPEVLKNSENSCFICRWQCVSRSCGVWLYGEFRSVGRRRKITPRFRLLLWVVRGLQSSLLEQASDTVPNPPGYPNPIVRLVRDGEAYSVRYGRGFGLALVPSPKACYQRALGGGG